MSQEDDFSPCINSMEVQENELSRSDANKCKQPPDGVTLPLNLKKLFINQLRRLATALGISAEGSASTVRQVIDGKLIQLGHDHPRNTQVVVSKVDSRLYQVNDSGFVAKEMEHVSSDNVVLEALVTSHGTNELPTM